MDHLEGPRGEIVPYSHSSMDHLEGPRGEIVYAGEPCIEEKKEIPREDMLVVNLKDILESEEYAGTIKDHLRSKTVMLALCNKTLARLYMGEAKSWKSRILFRTNNLNRSLLEIVEAPMWTSVSPDCKRFGIINIEPFDWTPVQVQLISFPKVVGPTDDNSSIHFTIVSCKTWGELEIDVRKECKRLRAKGMGQFRMMVELSKKLGMDDANFLRLSTKYPVYETVSYDVYNADP